MDEENFSLLENNLPDICADRLDYTIRDGLHLQLLSRQQADKIIDGLKVIESDGKKEFVFKDINSAEIYSDVFFQLNRSYYGSPIEAYFNHKMGDIMNLAIEKDVLKEEDWFGNDEEVIAKIKSSKDRELAKSLDFINNKTVIYEDNENPEVTLSKKIRIVNPKVEIDGVIKQLTEISPFYENKVNDYSEDHQVHELKISVLKKD